MAKTKARATGRQACIAALAAAGKPLTAGEVASAVVESGVVPTLKGKTPKATLSAQITSSAKRGETFRRVGSSKPQRFDLRSGVEAEPELVEALRGKVAELVAQRKTKAREPETATA